MGHNDKTTPWLVSLLSLAMAALCVVTYLTWHPVDGDRLGELIIHTIPEALVALLAFPVVYFVFRSRGISLHEAAAAEPEALAEAVVRHLQKSRQVLADFPTAPAEPMKRIATEVTKISESSQVPQLTNNAPAAGGNGQRDLLIVIDVQKDFFGGGSLPVRDAETIIPVLNDAIAAAERAGTLIVYTQDWHPPDHQSFKANGGTWPPHCLQGSEGAKIHPDLKFPATFETIKFGTDPRKDGYSPFENADLVRLVSREEVREIFVAGIALEYCVLATCRDASALGKRVTMIENLVAAAEPQGKADTLTRFDDHRIRRVPNHPWK